MATHHIALLHTDLAPEPWSKASSSETKLISELSVEEAARRKAIDARKEAQRLQNEALAAKDALEARYRTRQEEKARYTDAQRSWWDEEVIHTRQGNSTNYKADEEQHKAHKAHEAQMTREQRAIAHRERRVKQQMDNFHAQLDLESKRKREADALDWRDTSVANQKNASENRKQQNYQIQRELKEAATKEAEAHLMLAHDKFKTGEFERKTTELKRQELEVQTAVAKAKDEATGHEMFIRDEAARATLEQRKQTHAATKLNWGLSKQKADEKERKDAEKAARKKKAADQKAFHETTRRKKAEAALVKEKEKRHKEEYEATEMQRNAEHARQGMNEALERAKMASSDLKAKTDAAKTSAPTEARTAFESKQRAIYGAGEGKKVFAARGAA